tara:strand:+ start:223 stop:444 length:222 start_codon:yes stop_codon:yes gene_type:complete
LYSIFLKQALPLLLFKMKNENFISKNYEQTRLETENTNNLLKGITKALPEKYKPKALCNLATLSGRRVQKRIA